MTLTFWFGSEYEGDFFDFEIDGRQLYDFLSSLRKDELIEVITGFITEKTLNGIFEDELKEFFEDEAKTAYEESKMSDAERYGVSDKDFI